jgi:hypothetical protein
MLVRAKNNLTDFAVAKSFLAVSGTAGQTVFNLQNAVGFKDDYAIQLGETGEDKSEVVLLNGTPGNQLATAAVGVKFAHPSDTPVYCYYYNQVVFYKSASGTAGTSAAITDGTVTITPDQEYTVFNDTSTLSGDAWQTAFRNSALDVVSSKSDWIQFSGFQAYSLSGLRSRAKNNVNADIPDDTWNGWLQEWQQEMNNGAVKVNKDYSMGTVDVAFSGTAQEGTITNEDFMKPRRVWMIDTSGTYRATHTQYNGYYPDEAFNATAPRYYFRGDNVIGRLPADASGTARIAYDSSGTLMESDSDLLPLPMRPYWKSFIDYSLSRAYRHPSIKDLTNAQKLETQAYALRDRFIQDITPRDMSSQEMVRITETEGLDNAEWLW